MYVYMHTFSMQNQTNSLLPLKKQFYQKVASLWPVMKGSLTKTYKPCIRANCTTCQQGDKHPSWIWTYADEGKRHCLYVSASDVAFLRQGLKNGRLLERFLYRVAPAFLKQQRQLRQRKKSDSKSKN